MGPAPETEAMIFTSSLNWHRRRRQDEAYHGVTSVRRRHQACSSHCPHFDGQLGEGAITQEGVSFNVTHEGDTICIDNGHEGWQFKVPVKCSTCFADEQCGEGYTCKVSDEHHHKNECVAKVPAQAGESCDTDEYCVEGLICFHGSCAKPSHGSPLYIVLILFVPLLLAGFIWWKGSQQDESSYANLLDGTDEETFENAKEPKQQRSRLPRCCLCAVGDSSE